MPLRPQLSLVSGPKFFCEVRAELIAPLPDCFLGQLNTAPRHHLLDVSVTQREPEVEPDHLADDIGAESDDHGRGQLGQSPSQHPIQRFLSRPSTAKLTVPF
jgi:hypothetical protein